LQNSARTVGGMTFPHDTERHRREIEDAMQRVPAVLEHALDAFEKVFGRRPHGALSAEWTDDADVVLIATNTMARTARSVVKERRERGEKVGLVKLKMFRPFPRRAILEAIGPATHVGVLDRNHSPGSGGIFWNEVAVSLREHEVLLQDYLVGLGGGDVTPALINEIIDDLAAREDSTEPVWKEILA
jgi:pyruvate/2-oxoacid:ferredoxin oxidoreductase alpha subunit